MHPTFSVFHRVFFYREKLERSVNVLLSVNFLIKCLTQEVSSRLLVFCCLFVVGDVTLHGMS